MNKLYRWTNVIVDVASQHRLFNFQDLSINDNVLDATHKWDTIGVEGLEPTKKCYDIK